LRPDMRRDTAAMAAQDLPEANRQFRKFGLPPPKNRKRRPIPRAASFENFGNTNAATNATADAAAQRGLAIAARRAAQLDRVADLLLSIGGHLQAERLSHRAAELRAVLR
jgi:hypothetical protein